MKQESKDALIWALLTILICSVALNWLQCRQTDKLVEQVQDMEYYQQALASYIDEMETDSSGFHEDE